VTCAGSYCHHSASVGHLVDNNFLLPDPSSTLFWRQAQKSRADVKVLQSRVKNRRLSAIGFEEISAGVLVLGEEIGGGELHARPRRNLPLERAALKAFSAIIRHTWSSALLFTCRPIAGSVTKILFLNFYTCRVGHENPFMSMSDL
jgi:hypothetical protein